MGKLSDVIRHAGELSEETDDEDFEESFEEDSDEQDGADETTDEPYSTDDVSDEDESSENGVPVNAEPASAASEPEWLVESHSEEGTFAEDAEGTGTSDGSEGEDEPDAEVEPGAENESGAAEDPVCNEEGIPLVDVEYAGRFRNHGPELVVVPSVMNRKIILDFLLRHAYGSFSGYTGVLLSICAIGAAIYTYGRIDMLFSLFLLVAGCLFVVVEPLMLRGRARVMTEKGGQFHVPITYILTPYQIELTRNGNHATYPWSGITRVITTKYALVLYNGKHTAFILTKKGIGDQSEDLKAMVRRCARDAKYVRIKI